MQTTTAPTPEGGAYEFHRTYNPDPSLSEKVRSSCQQKLGCLAPAAAQYTAQQASSGTPPLAPHPPPPPPTPIPHPRSVPPGGRRRGSFPGQAAAAPIP